MPVELSVVDGVLCLAKTSPQLNSFLLTCYTTCLYVVHSKRALNSGEAHRLMP